MRRFDAIIIGAGPAGSMAAFGLADAGVRVLLLDKARFPRDKPCGGGLSVRALRQLPVDPAPVVEHIVERIEFSFRRDWRSVRGGQKPLAHMTQRRRLDHFLVEQAVAAGADFQDGVKVRTVSEGRVRVGREWVAGELLIGADGANGSTARLAGLGGRRIHGVALEGNLAHRPTDQQRWRGTAVIELGTIRGGYGWILPKADHLNVGVGGWESEGPSVRAHLRELCEGRGLNHSRIEALRGYRLPLRAPNTPIARGRVMLVGDAAGLVDPLWGDGLYSAFLSSKLAVGAGLDCLAGRIAGLEPYANSVLRELGPMIAFAWNAKLALDRLPQLAARAVLSAPGWRLGENMLRGDVREPRAERGLAGIAVRGLEAVASCSGWPGPEYSREPAAR